MAIRSLKTRFEFDNLNEYKQALGELNSGSRVLASEMRKLKAEYEGQEDSTKYLTELNDLLNRKIEDQKDKIELLKNAVKESAEKNGEASKTTQDWIVKLNDAEAEMYKLEHAVDENNAAMQGENTTMIGLGDTVDSLAGKFGISLPDGAKKALDGIGQMSAGTVAAMAAAAGAVVGVVEGLKKLHEMTLEAAADVDEIVTEAAVTGLSEDTIQKLKYAENLVDVSYSTITGSLTKLTKNMASAKDGNADLTESFAKLGVSIEDGNGNLRRSEEVFYDLIDALGRVENDTERDALAMDILGKSAQELNPLIKSGSGVLRELGEEAENTGYVLDEYQIKKLGAVDDAYQRMQLQIDATKKQLAAEFAPASQKVMETFSQWVGKAGKSLEESGILSNIASIVENLMDMLQSVGDLIGEIPILKDSLKILGVVLGGIADLAAVIADAFDLIAGVFTLDFNRAATALGFNYGSGQASNLQRVRMQQQGTWDTYESYYAGRNASGNDNWRGGLTYIGESGAELAMLPSGTQILNAQDTRAALGGDTFYITIDAHNVKDFMDVVEMAKSERLRRRMA